MRLTLILAGPYNSCILTREIWKQACIDHRVDIDIVSLDDDYGNDIANLLNLKSFPALIHKNKVIAVGHPDKQAADKILTHISNNT